VTPDIKLGIGEEVWASGKPYRILRPVDLEVLVALDESNGDRVLLKLANLQPSPVEGLADSIDLKEVPEEEWKIAQERFEAIRSLLGDGKRSVEEIDEIATKAEVSRATIYRWVERFASTGTVSGLLRGHRKGVSQQSRLPDAIEKVVKETIDESLTLKNPTSARKLAERVASRCRALDLKPPHANTVMVRVRARPPAAIAKVHGSRRDQEKFEPVPGTFPGATYPLQFVQIDHTRLDIEVVDELFRLPICRPWLTLLIDVNSRVVPGFHLALESPSSVAVGLAVVHAILPKEQWLAERDVQSDWPVWGKPSSVHADNAGEFRGAAMKRACENHSIDLTWRPVKKPRYGAHIERLIGTVNTLLKDLPGRTGASVKERGDRNPGETASFTLRELEAYLTKFVIDVYHRRRHPALGVSPIEAYRTGLHGKGLSSGRGLPPRVTDGKSLLRDFLPEYKRTVQPDGISIECVRYYSPALRQHVGSRTPEGKARQFVCRRHPHAISPIHFFDPDSRMYVEVPYADLSRPNMSSWELAAAKRRVEAQGGEATEDCIFKAHEELARMERDAVERTKTARKKVEQKRARDKLFQESVTTGVAVKTPSAVAAAEADAAAKAQVESSQPAATVRKPSPILEVEPI